jgi:hypothetical protein
VTPGSGVICEPSLFLLSAADTFRPTVVAQARLAKETNWAWVYTGPLFDAWESLTGKAIVTVEGARFSAKLFDSGDPTFVRFTLTGTIKGAQIAVQAVLPRLHRGADDHPV